MNKSVTTWSKGGLLIFSLLLSYSLFGQAKTRYILDGKQYYYSEKFPYYNDIGEFSVERITHNQLEQYKEAEKLDDEDKDAIYQVRYANQEKLFKIKTKITRFQKLLALTNFFLDHWLPNAENVAQDIRKEREQEAKAVKDSLDKAIRRLELNQQRLNEEIESASLILEVMRTLSFKEQEFRKKITWWAFWIIGILIISGAVLFFTWNITLAIGRKIKLDNFKLPEINAVMDKLVGIDGLQFVTLFILIVVIMIFGILDIENRQLITIIASVASYILGNAANTRRERPGRLDENKTIEDSNESLGSSGNEESAQKEGNKNENKTDKNNFDS